MAASRRYALLSGVVGAALAAGCLAFVVSRITTGWEEAGDTIREARWGWTVIGVLLAVAGMGALGLVWRSVLSTLGVQATRPQVLFWYQLGNLGKYLPGGIAQVLGRAELAARDGVPRATAYSSVGLSMGATYLCGALVAAALLPLAVMTHADVTATWWVLLVVPFGALALHPKVLGRLLTLAERVFGAGEEPRVPGPRESFVLVVRHVPGWLLNGLACYAVALAFTADAPFATVLFAGVASWVAGFLVVFVPGGIGVREAAFVAIAGAAMTVSTAATVALVSRLVFVAGDLLGAALATGLRRAAA